MLNNLVGSSKLCAPGICVLVLLISLGSVGQDKPAPVCKKSALAALKPLPKLRYRCGNMKDDYDEKILKAPQRAIAIKAFSTRLESFTYPDWWRTSIEDLSVCDVSKKAGPLNAEQTRTLANGDYLIRLLGNDRLRLVLVEDPCYQTSWNGMDGFLLYRNGGKVFATEVLDGFYSRADNPVDFDFAGQNSEQIVEISTSTGGLNPEITNYYFAIDPRTNRAIPKKLFKGDKGLSNEITSAMLMSGSDDADATEPGPLQIIRDHKLANEFSIYSDDSDGKIDDNGRKLTRTVLRWNGRFYQ